jgi:hypothetical protein
MQPLNQGKKPLESLMLIGNSLGCSLVRDVLDFREAHQTGIHSALTNDVRCCNTVSHAINPGTKRTTLVEVFEALPQREMNILQKIAAAIRVSFIASGESLDGGTEHSRCIPVELILTAIPSWNALR